MQLKELLNKKVIKKETRKIEFSYQALAIEISDYFQVKTKQVFYLFYRYPEQDIYEAFQVSKKNHKPFQYLLGILTHRK